MMHRSRKQSEPLSVRTLASYISNELNLRCKNFVKRLVVVDYLTWITIPRLLCRCGTERQLYRNGGKAA